MGNCIAVKGKLRPASAVYPLHNCTGLLNFRKAWIVALPSKTLLLDIEEALCHHLSILFEDFGGGENET